MTTTKRISELPSASTLTGDELLPLVQDGATRKATVDDVREGLAHEVHTHELADIVDAGTAAAADVEDFATAAQGVKADTAVQPGDIGTAATHATSYFATAAQGAKADTAVQPGDIGTAATHATSYFATAAQGAKADTALQPADASSFATAAQGATADSAVQPGDLEDIATTGEFADLLNAPIQGMENAIINGCCRVTHRDNATLSNSWQYGPVDLVGVKALGTVSAGTIKRDSASSVTATAFAAWVDSATLDSDGVVLFRHRIEAKDVWRFKNKPAYFSCRVYHNVGSAINFTTTIRKATASDNFSSTTDITNGTQSIASATASDVTLSVSDMGDCTNGVEVEVKAVCGAVNTKSFYIGDLQLVIANFKRPFLARPMAMEELLVSRFVRWVRALHGIANSTSAMQLLLSHPNMRVAVTYSAVNALDLTDGYVADKSQSSAGITTTHEATKDFGRITCSSFSSLTQGRYYFQRGTDKYILASAEF